MRHCNSVFSAQDIWFLLDNEKYINRKLYLANCPICNKKIALYSYGDKAGNFFEQYFYSGGATRIKEKFKKAKGLTLLDNVEKGIYPMPIFSNGHDDVFVGRIRRDLTNEKGLAVWCCGDQVRKGAATNAVQIAEKVIELNAFNK